MSLTLKFDATVNDRGATELLLKDTTGAYNATTNPTGYGVANSFITPTLAAIKYKTWDQSSWVQKVLTPAQLTSIMSANGLAVGPDDLGGTAGVFKDGINQLQYAPLNSASATAVFTNGSKIVQISGGFNPNTPGSALVGFIIGIANAADPNGGDAITKAYEVDWRSTATNDATQITLLEAFAEDTVSIALYYGPYDDDKILVNKAAEKCIAETLASSSSLGCGCESTYPQVNKMIQWRFAADVAYDCGDYTGAHNTIVQLNRICNQTSLACACF